MPKRRKPTTGAKASGTLSFSISWSSVSIVLRSHPLSALPSYFFSAANLGWALGLTFSDHIHPDLDWDFVCSDHFHPLSKAAGRGPVVGFSSIRTATIPG